MGQEVEAVRKTRDGVSEKLTAALKKRGLMIENKNQFSRVRSSNKTKAMRIAMVCKSLEREQYEQD